MPKLTKRFLDSIEPQHRETVFWDDDLKGFGLRVKPSGIKSFLIQYRNAEGTSKRQTLGRSSVLTAEQARRAARERLAAVALGTDPVSDQQKARKSWTITRLARAYLEEAEAGRLVTRRGVSKSASTLATDRGRIEHHILPLIGQRRLSELTRKDVRDMVREIEAGKTAISAPSGNPRGRTIVSGGRGTAKRTAGLLAGMLTWAQDQELINHNPAHGLRLPKDNRRHVSNVREIYRALGAALDAASLRAEPWQAVKAIYLGALTGLRRGEVVNLLWKEVDFEAQVVTLPNSKTGFSVRPLAQLAVDELKAIRERQEPGPFVFPAVRNKGQAYGGLPGAWKRITTSDELNENDTETLAGFTFHGLRHSFATRANALGLTLPTVSALLGHASAGVTQSYISHADFALLRAASYVADKIRDDMTPENEPIVPYRVENY